MNPLKEKLRSGINLAGTHVRLLDSAVTELLANLDFDFIWIDMEHSAIDFSVLQQHLIAARAGGTPSVVRIPWNDQVTAKRVLDIGAEGIVFPMINTAEEASYAIQSCIYPPEGTRGAGPTRASKYSLTPFDKFIKTHMELCRFIQIESKIAVDNIHKIVNVPYMDGIIIGPCDMSGSIGDLGNLYGDENLRLIDRVVMAANAVNIPTGVSIDSNDPEILRFWVERGIKILSSGMDFVSILKEAQLTRRAITNAFDQASV